MKKKTSDYASLGLLAAIAFIVTVGMTVLVGVSIEERAEKVVQKYRPDLMCLERE